jgi:hypothetical protein
MKTFYVVRVGWNAANQSALGRPANPKNDFESGRYCFIGSVEAGTVEEAIRMFSGHCYANQTLFAVTTPRSVRGLTAAIREAFTPV